MKGLRVDVWSDVACPWCYVGKRRLEAALASFPQKDQVEVTWHSFELDPSAPRTQSQSLATLLSQKYGMPKAEAERMMKQTADTAKADNLDLQFEKVRPGNTVDAHRLIHLAKKHGKQDQMKERLMRAYFTEGAAVGDHDTLRKLGEEVGLPTAEVTDMLASDQFEEDVRADEEEAAAIGVRGVPFFVFGEKYAVSGAQPAEALRSVLDKTWSELGSKKPEDVVSEGEVCGPEGCA